MSADGQEALETPLGYQDWRRKVETDLRGGDVDKTLRYRDADDLGLRILEHESTVPTAGDPSGLPGVAPFTRGTQTASGPIPWIVGLEVAHGEVDAAREALLHDLSLGAGSAWLCFATTERPGIRLTEAEQLGRLLEGVETSILDLTFDFGANPLVTVGCLDAACRQTGLKPADLRGCLALDLFAGLATEGRLAADLDTSFEDLAKAARWCLDEAPLLRACMVSSRAFLEAGASPAQQLGWTLAAALETFRRLEEYGLDPARAATQVLAVHSVGRDLFLEIAKLRAWRLLWSKLLKVAGAEEAAGQQRMAVLPARSSLTRVDP